MRRRAPWVVLALGACLAGVLFMRQGGVSALINSAGSLHTNQGSGFYGQIGIWMLVGVALYSFAVLVQGGAAAGAARRVLSVSAPLAVASTLALGSRGFIVAGVWGRCVVYLRLRAPRAQHRGRGPWRSPIALGAVLEFTAVVRTNAASERPRDGGPASAPKRRSPSSRPPTSAPSTTSS